MNKYSWTPLRCARICTIILIISSFLFLFLIFSCPELKFQYTSCTSINTPCCRNIYRPGKPIRIWTFVLFPYEYFYVVCNINDPHNMFLSPCHFGCTNQTTKTGDTTTFYSSCNCSIDTIISETACRFRRIPC